MNTNELIKIRTGVLREEKYIWDGPKNIFAN
jgi:hypothetical protein